VTQDNITLPDILTEEQITKLITIWNEPNTTAEEICTKIIKPNLGQINKKLGILTDGRMLEADPKYLAYCCEHILSQADTEKEN
jgi:hypothetical protein